MNRKRVLALGCGVQSSAMALMMSRGEIEPPDIAIFADTGVEPPAVYRYLFFLKKELNFPIITVSAGNIEQDFLLRLAGKKRRCASPPFMVRNEQTGKKARLRRQCTKEYKLTPMLRKIRDWAGRAPVEQVIGISLDEARRMRPAAYRWLKNSYPLVEAGISRAGCLEWMKEHGYPEPPRSACYMCPYMSDTRIRTMRDHEPELYRRLVWFDGEIRRLQKEKLNRAEITGTLYIHRSCRPIDTIDLSTDIDRGQLTLF